MHNRRFSTNTTAIILMLTLVVALSIVVLVLSSNTCIALAAGDTTPPSKPIMTIDIGTKTVNFSGSVDDSGEPVTYMYSSDGVTFQSGDSYPIYDMRLFYGEVYIKAQDSSGNESQVAHYTIIRVEASSYNDIDDDPDGTVSTGDDPNNPVSYAYYDNAEPTTGITITATPREGYWFSGWCTGYDTKEIISTEISYTVTHEDPNFFFGVFYRVVPPKAGIFRASGGFLEIYGAAGTNNTKYYQLDDGDFIEYVEPIDIDTLPYHKTISTKSVSYVNGKETESSVNTANVVRCMPVANAMCHINGIASNYLPVHIDNYYATYINCGPDSGYKFAGWYDNPQFMGEPISTDKEFLLDVDLMPIDLYARIVEDPNSGNEGYHSVSFDVSAYGNFPAYSGATPEKVYFDNGHFELPVLSMKGYNFLGWCVDPERTIFWPSEFSVTPDFVLYAKWEVQHEHEYVLTEERVGNTIVQKYTCSHDGCNSVIFKYIKIDPDVVDSLDVLVSEPNEDNLGTAKDNVIGAIEGSIRQCFGSAVSKVVNRASGAIDQLEPSSDVADKLLDVYAKALSDVRLEKDKMQVITHLADTVNAMIMSNSYSDSSIDKVKAQYDTLEKEIRAIKDVVNVDYYYNTFSNYIASLQCIRLYADSGCIDSYEGFDSSYLFDIIKLTSSTTQDDSYDYYYNVALMHKGAVTNELDHKVTVTIHLQDLSNMHRANIHFADGTVVSGKIVDNSIQFVTNQVGEISIELVEPAPMYILYILLGVVATLAVVYVVIARKCKRSKA